MCTLMEYCSPIWAGAPASHLSRFHAVETKAFRIVGISRDEAESLGLSLSHHRQVGGLSTRAEGGGVWRDYKGVFVCEEEGWLEDGSWLKWKPVETRVG